MPPSKVCTACGVEKPRSEFYPRSPGRKSAGGQSNSECKPCCNARSQRGCRRRRDEAYARLGGRCFCCGESIRMFLNIDHKNDDGASHRREIGAAHATRTKGSASLALWLWGRPEEDHRFQIACWNCNAGRYLNGGTCPHGSSPVPEASSSMKVPAVPGTNKEKVSSLD